MITATYSGDSGNGAGSGTTIVANFQSASSSLVSSGTTNGSGHFTVNQGSTGVDTTITGSTSNANISVESAVLGTQPSGTGSISVGNGQYFDVEISGTSTGTANICITGIVDSSTAMSYYSGGGWVSATSITRTASSPAGASNGQICGNVPVSALTGTYFTVGDPLPANSATSYVYGNVTWTTPTYQGYQYIFSASVSINGKAFLSNILRIALRAVPAHAHTSLCRILRRYIWCGQRLPTWINDYTHCNGERSNKVRVLTMSSLRKQHVDQPGLHDIRQYDIIRSDSLTFAWFYFLAGAQPAILIAGLAVIFWNRKLLTPFVSTLFARQVVV